MSRINDALKLAKQGFYIFPLHNPNSTDQAGDPLGKMPRLKKWEDEATTDPAKIKKWWKDWPNANIGIAIGKSGCLAIDIDPDKGGDIALVPLSPEELQTRIQDTGRGGQHYIYRQPQDILFGNGNTFPAGIDVRGDGGYIVGPGSIHPETGIMYDWRPGHSPEDRAALPLPDSLRPFLKEKGKDEPAEQARTRPAPGPINGNVSPYARAAFQDELRILAAAPNGDRNNQLNDSAFALGQLVAAGGLDEAEVESELTRIALGIGLKERETMKTIKSGLTAGKKEPRIIPQPDHTNGKVHEPSNGYHSDGTGPKEEKPTRPADKPRMTDLGNARRLIAQFGEDLRYVKAWGKWYVWDGTRWAEDETGAIERLAKEVPKLIYHEALEAEEETRPKLMKWGATSESAGKIAAMIELARTEPGVSIRHRDLDNKPMLLNCLNGTINLRNGELLPHDRAHNITKRLELFYDPTPGPRGLNCPLWLKFLDRVMAGNQEMIDFLRRAVGYTLTGDVSEQCLFFMHGAGKNGKTVFSETLRSLFGEYGQKAPTDMLMIRYNSNVPNDVARLPGARFVIAAEVEEGRRLAESQVKDLTGGDTIVARFMRQEFFEFEPTHKLWMYGNHKPEIKGTDNGIWRRIHLIPFLVTIPKDERDPQLIKKLRSELSGILAWAVQGCLEWQDKGLQVPALVEQATDSYRAEMDIISEFLQEKCVRSSIARVKAGELHLEYLKWCEANEERPLKRPKFGRAMRERGFVSDDSGKYTEWVGIGLKAEFAD